MRMVTRSLGPVEFLNEVVYPALFERLDEAFPAFGWRRSARGWTATNRETTKTLPGEPRPERVVCNQPFGFLVHGGRPTSWTAYVNGGTTPTGRDFVEVVRTLADLAGVDASVLDRELTPEQAAAHERRERGQALLETFLSQAGDALHEPDGRDAVDYLAGRGFPNEPDGLAELGFGLYSTAAEVEAQLVDAGFTADEVAGSGLLRDGRWAGRLVLPWRDRRGRVGTVAARDLTGTADEGAKYLYLAGHSKPEAFGLDVALRPAAGGRDHLVLVEGLLDVVALQRAGFANVAALGGAGNLLAADRWAALAGFKVRRVTLVLDNDEAGRQGTVKALDGALEAKAAPEVWVVDPAELGDAKDPDELVRREGLEAFRAVLDQRVSGNLYRTRLLLEDVTPTSPDHERREAVEKFLDLDRRLRGPRVKLDREDALRLVAERTGYTVEVLAAQAEDHRERRRREDAEETLRQKLREAQDALAADEVDPVAVAATLTGALAEVQARAQDEPPAFSVDRLLEVSKVVPEGKRTGWAALDREDIYFNAGELTLLAARTGHAKTAVAVNLLTGWLRDPTADPDELLVLYSAEEAEVAVFRRLVALLTAAYEDPDGRWTVKEVRAKLQGGEPPNHGTWPLQAGLASALDRLRSWEGRLLVVYAGGWAVDQLVAHAKTVAARRSVGAVVVDYLQRVAPPAGFDKGRRRDEEVSAIARALKALAVAVEVPVVTGAQVNREAVKDAKKVPKGDYGDEMVQKAIRSRRPQLHHLREGGSEQEADLVLGLLNYRADYEEDDEGERRDDVGRVPEATRLDIGALKNRYGAVGRWAGLALEARYGLVRDPERGEV